MEVSVTAQAIPAVRGMLNRVVLAAVYCVQYRLDSLKWTFDNYEYFERVGITGSHIIQLNSTNKQHVCTHNAWEIPRFDRKGTRCKKSPKSML